MTDVGKQIGDRIENYSTLNIGKAVGDRRKRLASGHGTNQVVQQRSQCWRNKALPARYNSGWKEQGTTSPV